MKGPLLVVYLIGSAAVALVALAVAVRRAPDRSVKPPAGIEPISETGDPIAAEALVFRAAAGRTALEPEAGRERSAHPRTLGTFRFLRAYPGAPPRIPHGLSDEEFRTGTCGTCHERGGYSIRFAAYTPVTPHPELKPCLGCHAGDDAVAGRTAPRDDPNTRCPQCHGPEGRVRPREQIGWIASLWSQPASGQSGSVPPVIPHERSFREDCLACHAGPAAVKEIRTTHPEWVGCRTCHVEVDPEALPFRHLPAETGAIP
jgi:nitrate reductase cytochrome c-type subunit